MGRYGVEIILHVKNDRQAVERGDVHRFIGRALQGRAIAEEGNRNSLPVEDLVCEGITGGMGNIAADDRAGSGNARSRIAHMHRAAAPAAIARIQPHDFGHEAINRVMHAIGEIGLKNIEIRWRLGIDQFCQDLMVGAVRAIDLVIGFQHRHGADRSSLLTNACMGRSMDQTRLFKIEYLFFEPADQLHLAIPFQQIGRFCILPILVRGIQPIPGCGWFQINFLCHCESFP